MLESLLIKSPLLTKLQLTTKLQENKNTNYVLGKEAFFRKQ